MSKLALAAEMLGDWHVGTGTGRHAFVDRLLQRDASGLPYIPAKTLAGVWRDACETVVHALDGGAVGPWHGWLDFVFGSQPALEERGVVDDGGTGRPLPAALFLDSLHYPPDLAEALRSKPQLRQAAVFLKPGVAIDEATGRAEDKKLWFEEMARGGVTLRGQATIAGSERLDAEQLECVSALLDAGAHLVEGIGGKRRRGAGRCRLRLISPAADWTWLRDRTAPPLPDAAESAAPQALVAPGEHNGWEVAELRMVLQRPLVAHERTVGNAVRSTGYVPGSVLLPAVLQRLDCADAALAARRSELVVTDATVEVDGQAGQSAPLALVHDKGTSDTWHNLLAQTPSGLQAEPFAGRFVGDFRPGEPLRVESCARTEHTHNTIDDREQRSVEAIGGLYTYQALAAGSVLRAQVRVPAGLLPPGWQDRLSGTWRLGRTRKDGYGLTEVAASATEPPAARAVPEGPLRVWLLSDVLITDGRLRSSTRPEDLAAELGRALGVELHPVDDVDDAGVLGRVSEAHRTESWHRRWGLPRASLLGIAAGSCFSFHLTGGTLTAEALQQVETAGIGLRRAEGFGQVRVDDPLLYAASGSLSGPAERAGSAAESVEFPHAVLDAHGELLDVLEDAAWRNEIRCNSEAVARDRRREVLGEHHENVPPSQIGALRMLVSQITRPDDGRAYAWLKRLRPGAEPRRMWPEATLDGIEELLTAADRVWTILALPEPDITASRDRIRRQRARLWPAAVRTLVEDCLTAHARAAHERGED